MRYLVTGADGFIGTHVVGALLSRGHAVIATSIDRKRAEGMPWFGKVEYHELDLSSSAGRIPECFRAVNNVVHLAWADIPRYREMVHIDRTLMWSYPFLSELVRSGVSDVTVLGTCLEYGLFNGELTEAMVPVPVVPYAVAKDALRRFLEQLQRSIRFRLKWLRLFYVYGPGQRSDSLLGALDAAILRNDSVFEMSVGEQIRDYLPVDRVAQVVAGVSEQTRVEGVINCGSGRPISIRRFVEEYVSARGAQIRLTFGVKPIPDYEPLAFWASTRKLRQALGEEL